LVNSININSCLPGKLTDDIGSSLCLGPNTLAKRQHSTLLLAGTDIFSDDNDFLPLSLSVTTTFD